VSIYVPSDLSVSYCTLEALPLDPLVCIALPCNYTMLRGFCEIWGEATVSCGPQKRKQFC